MLPNGTLSVNERKTEFFYRFSAVSRRVRYKNGAGRYALNTVCPHADLLKGRFFIFMNRTKEVWKRVLFSSTLATKNESHKIAYIAVTTALIVGANMFFEFKFAETQFSLTLAISALTGFMIGPLFGFVACFLGDLVGFLYHSAGYAYLPWIGISMGLTASIAGLCGELPFPFKGGKYVKLALVALLSFSICTVAINTTAFWFLYARGVPYTTYLVSRLFVQGQIWNSVFNYALLFIAVPTLSKVKPLGLNL